MIRSSSYVQALLLICLAAVASSAYAATTYQFSNIPYGDTAGLVDMNDNGDLAYTGFGSGGFPCPCGRVVEAPAYAAPGIFVNALRPGGGRVTLSDINNAGWLRGQSERADGTIVPTVWREDGVPLDMTDPANAGVVFIVDPGPKNMAFDLPTLLSLTVIDLPAEFGGGPASVLGGAFTNGAGQIAFEYSSTGTTLLSRYALLTPIAEVPLPGTATLLLVALAVLSRRVRN